MQSKFRERMTQTLSAIGVAFFALAGGSALAQEVRLSPDEVVQRALRQNLELEYERQNPSLSMAPLSGAEAQFDPTLFSSAQVAGSPGTISPSRVGLSPASSTQASGDVGVRKDFSTGTSVSARLGTSALFGDSRSLNPAYQTGLYLDVRQSLLRGHSMDANELAISNARRSRDAGLGRYERRGEVVAAEALRTYWDLHAAIAYVAVQKAAVGQAETTLAETEALIAGGKQAAAEAVVTRYQVQAQKRALLGAEQVRDNMRDRLARQIGLVTPRSLETPAIVTAATPETELPKEGPAQLQDKALARRGDVRAVATDADSRKAELAATKHLLLPRLDLVGSVGLQGLSGTVSGGEPSGFGQSYWSSYAMSNVGWSVGLVFEIPLGNRAAEAKRDIASLEMKRAELMMERVAQAVSEELNVAWRAVRTTREQFEVTVSAADVAETKVQNELARYRAGKTSAQNLTLMQAELVRERLNKEQALADFNKALVDFRAASGTLLDREKRTA